MIIRWLFIACNLFVLGCSATSAPGLKTENVVLITTDGLRWQDVFTGADQTLLNKEHGGVANLEQTRAKFWRDTPEARREAMMPFLWNTVVPRGQIFGNATAGSVATVTNDKRFSYPGYNEILCGFADPGITSNEKILNKNVTVLEWLHEQPTFKGGIAAFAAWDAMPFIINRERCGFPVFGGWQTISEKNSQLRQQMLDDLIKDSPKTPEDETHDAFAFYAALEHLKKYKPRVLYVSFGQTDSFAHQGRYDQVLGAANRVDTYIRKLWEATQSMDGYRGKTTFIISVDHGRGGGLVQWKDHGAKIAGSENIWIAVMGPDTPALGERKDCEKVTQNQIAATLAQFVAQDYHAAVPKSGAAIADVFPHPK